MYGGIVLTLVLFLAVQAAAQGLPKVPFNAPEDGGTSPLALLRSRAAWSDPSLMFPYSVPEEGPSSPPEQIQCEFSDGKTVTVSYSTRHVKATHRGVLLGPTWVTVFDEIRFVNAVSLVAVKNIAVPAGNYRIIAGPVFGKQRGGWTLYMAENEGIELHVPMAETNLASPAKSSAIVFERSGGSCVMRVNSKNENTQASVEFAEKDTYRRPN